MKRTKILIIAIALAFLGGSVHATTVLRKSLDDMVNKADIAVVASPYKTSTGKVRGIPITFTTLKVSQVLLGSTDVKEVTVRQLGGKVGSRQVVVAGEPKLKTGQEVLLLLKKTDGDAYMIVGMFQGRFSINRDKQTGKKVVKETDYRSGKQKEIFLDDFAKKIKAIRANQMINQSVNK